MIAIMTNDTGVLLSALAGAAVKVVPLLAATWFVATRWRKASAASRHALWLASIVVTLALPVLGVFLPRWKVALLRAKPVLIVNAAPLRADSVAPLATATAPISEPGAPPVSRRQESSISTLAAIDPDGSNRAPRSTWLSRVDAPSLILLLWMTGAVAVFVPLVFALFIRRSLSRTASRWLSPEWRAVVQSLRTQHAELERVMVLESERAAVPMTWGVLRPTILVPEAPDWTPSMRRAALLHELAHVRRRDVIGFLAARMACAIYWYNPLVWVAARALRNECELACDDRVLAAGARASDYAQQLLDVAESSGPDAYRPAAAALTMARRGTLPGRLRAVLDGSRNRATAHPGVARALALGAGLVAIPLAAFTPVRGDTPLVAEPYDTPASSTYVTSDSIGAASLPQSPAAPLALSLTPRVATPASQSGRCLEPPRRGSTSSMNWNESNGREKVWRVRWSFDDCRFDMEARGEVDFNDQLTDVRRISRGGHLEVELREGNQSRRVRFLPDGGGIEREYFVNGRQREFDDAAQAWFAEVLIAIDRRTAFAVDQRLPALLRRGGVPAVLQEVELMPSDYARRRYVTKLLETERLTTAQLRDVLARSARTFSSDYEKAELLLSLSKLDTFDDDAQYEFAVTAGTITSDYERRRALNALLGRSALSRRVVRTLLESAQGMKSDYELAELLLGVARRYAVDEDTRPLYVRAMSSIQSDYERRRVLEAVATGADARGGVTADMLAAAEAMSSDYELAEFLIKLLKRGPVGSSNYETLFRVVGKLRSDYEHHRVLSAALASAKDDRALVEHVLRSARGLQSDYECAQLLIEVARAVSIDSRLRPLFDDAADTIQSEYEYGRTMAAIRRR